MIRPGSLSAWVAAQLRGRWQVRRCRTRQEDDQDLPARTGWRRRAADELCRHVGQAVQHGRPERLPLLGDAERGGAERATETVDPTTLGFWPRSASRRASRSPPDERMRKILAEAVGRWRRNGRTLYRNREKEALLRGPQPEAPVHRRLQVRVAAGRRQPHRQRDVLFAATGVTPAMDTQIVGEGSTYPWTASDAMTTARRRQDPQAPFAAEHPGQDVLVGDRTTRRPARCCRPTTAFRASAARTKAVKANADGSVDVYFGPKAPAGQESNWVQTIPGKSWFTILRLYGPLEPWFPQAVAAGQHRVGAVTITGTLAAT